jgi:predicted anti-sigma-YlaC factor YlaD
VEKVVEPDQSCKAEWNTETVRAVSLYLSGSCSPELKQLWDSHLRVCEACRFYVEIMKGVIAFADQDDDKLAYLFRLGVEAAKAARAEVLSQAHSVQRVPAEVHEKGRGL